MCLLSSVAAACPSTTAPKPSACRSKTSPRNATPSRARRAPDRIYVDHGLTGTNRARPGLREAMAACRAGDDRTGRDQARPARRSPDARPPPPDARRPTPDARRPTPDARDIVAELTAREVKLSLGGSVHDPTDPVGRPLLNVLAMVAEFESDLIK